MPQGKNTKGKKVYFKPAEWKIVCKRAAAVNMRTATFIREIAVKGSVKKVENMGKIIAIANQKGGVGKTTSVVHLGAALKMSGRKVLLIDFDPQGDTSAYMGFEEDESRTVSQVMEDFVKFGSADICEVIRKSEKNDNIEYIPADISLAGAEMYLISVMSRETVLKSSLYVLFSRSLYVTIL